jgi:ankyrin repeat protein
MNLTAFHESVKKGDLEQVKAGLLEDKSLLAARNDSGQSALLLAQYYGQPKIAEYLLSLEPELDIYESCAVGSLARVNRALNTQPDLLESHSPDGWTPLHLSAFFGQAAIAEALLDRGAKVDSRSTNTMQNTPLHAAAAGGHTALVELLLKHGADVNARQQGGWTALHAAAQAGQRDMAALLLEHAADVQLRADNNQTPLDLALLGGKADVVAVLEKFDSPADQQVN